MKKIKTDYNGPAIAVIGSGYWGRNLVRNYYEIGALKIVCDNNPSVHEDLKENYPDVEINPTFHDLLSRTDIDGVVIATPAETHFPLAQEALLSGKHVYVEKPLVLDEVDAENLIELASQQSRILMVGHLLQYHPMFLKLKELAAKGDLGRINYIYSNRLNLGKIRREENILWSFAPHDISMILALTGEEPENVMASGGNYLHRKIADVTTTHLEFPSGIQAHIFVSWLHPFKEQKLVVVGDRKMAVFDDTKPWKEKLLLYPHKINWEKNVPIPAKADPEFVHVAEAEPLRKECEQFLQCIEDGIHPITDGNEGLRVLRVLKASQQSLNTNGQRIVLNKNGHKTPDKTQPGASGDEVITETTDFYVDPTAVVDDHVEIGDNTKIWHYSHIIRGSKIGDNCNLGQNVMVGPDVTIGSRVKIQNNVSIFPGVTLEDGVFCGPSMVFTNVYNPRSYISRKNEIRQTLVKEGATLGANCTIVCGHTIGRFAFIAAGAVVTEDVPDFALAVGNPAEIKGWMCRCGVRIYFKDGSSVCEQCGLHYNKDGNTVVDVQLLQTEKDPAGS